jgi:hypothetical protein
MRKIYDIPVLAHGCPSSLAIAYLKAALGALNAARVGILFPHGNSKNGGQQVAHLLFAFIPLCAAESRRLVRGFRRGLSERVARVP